MSNYKKLNVWRISMKTVREVYNLTNLYPDREKYGLVSQSNRAAVSIPSNIAEGLGRNHKRDTVQFLHISRGSAYELETLLSVAFMLGLIDRDNYNKVNEILDNNIRLINGLIKYIEIKLEN